MNWIRQDRRNSSQTLKPSAAFVITAQYSNLAAVILPYLLHKPDPSPPCSHILAAEELIADQENTSASTHSTRIDNQFDLFRTIPSFSSLLAHQIQEGGHQVGFARISGVL